MVFEEKKITDVRQMPHLWVVITLLYNSLQPMLIAIINHFIWLPHCLTYASDCESYHNPSWLHLSADTAEPPNQFEGEDPKGHILRNWWTDWDYWLFVLLHRQKLWLNLYCRQDSLVFECMSFWFIEREKSEGQGCKKYCCLLICCCASRRRCWVGLTQSGFKSLPKQKFGFQAIGVSPW